MAKAGRTGVELDDVAAAMAALGAEGIRPTIRAIRDRLGRGSLGTIQRHLAAIQDREGAGTVSKVGIPESVATALAKWVAEEVSHETSALRADLESARETLHLLVAENEAVTAARDDGLEREADFLSEVDAAKSQLEVAEQAYRDVRAELSAAAAVERSTSEKLVRAEVRLEQMKDMEVEASRLRDQVVAFGVENAQLRSSLASVTSQVQVLQEQVQGKTRWADECQESLGAKEVALDIERQRREVAEAEVTRLMLLLERLIAMAPEKRGAGEAGVPVSP